MKSIPLFCRVLILSLAISFISVALLPRLIAPLLPLYSQAVFPGLQLWRLATYPFFTFGIISTLSACVLIYFFGSELELIVKTRRLAIWLSSSVILEGILFVFLARGGATAGPASLYLFIVAGFTYLWPKREISIFGIFSVKSWILAAIVFLLNFLPFEGVHMDLSLERIFPILFSPIAAIIIFHANYRQYRFGLGMLGAIAKRLPWHSERVRGRDVSWDETLAVEHRIDAILDKISRKGMDSLTREEREFLLKQSR